MLAILIQRNWVQGFEIGWDVSTQGKCYSEYFPFRIYCTLPSSLAQGKDRMKERFLDKKIVNRESIWIFIFKFLTIFRIEIYSKGCESDKSNQ